MRKTTGTLFAVWLKKNRKAKGLTLETLARAAGTHKGYISGIENSKVAPPSAGVTRKICRAFGLGEDAVLNALLRGWIDKSPDAIRDTLMSVFGKELS